MLTCSICDQLKCQDPFTNTIIKLRTVFLVVFFNFLNEQVCKACGCLVNSVKDSGNWLLANLRFCLYEWEFYLSSLGRTSQVVATSSAGLIGVKKQYLKIFSKESFPAITSKRAVTLSSFSQLDSEIVQQYWAELSKGNAVHPT